MRRLQLLVLAVLLTSLVVPAMAGEKFLYGSPELSASISGTNEFTPGADLTLTVTVENSGLNMYKIASSTIISRDDQPNTAKMVTAALLPNGTAFTIKSDPQFLGDIAGGRAASATFSVKVADTAAPGTYILPLRVTYTYLWEAEQSGFDTVRYYYSKKTATLPLAVRIRPDLRIDVVDVRTEHLNVGTEGYLYLTLRNTGYESGARAIARIVRNGASPLIPTDGSVYIGDFAPGDEVPARFRVAVSGNAEEQAYPIDVRVDYEDTEGNAASSNTVTIGLPVGGKTAFEVVSPAAVLHPGEKAVLEVVYRNTGATTAYNAQARLSAIDPFTSNDDTAFLGDLAPGDEAVARFKVNVDGDATIKIYGLDTEIRYRDALDNSQISDTMKVQVQLEKKSGAVFENPMVIAVAAVAMLGTGYYMLVLRKKG